MDKHAQLEKKAMDLLKNKWSHLYTFGYPTKPYPTNYENDLNNVLLGLYQQNTYTHEEMVEFAKEQCKKLIGKILDNVQLDMINYFEATEKQQLNGVPIYEDNGSDRPLYIVVVNNMSILKCYDENEIK